MSCILVFLLAIAQAILFCGTDDSMMARIIDERWQWSLPWVLRMDAVVPVTVSFFGCVAFQHRYLTPLCARASYIIIGHGGVISPAWASALLSCGTVLAYTYIWFLRCKKAVGKELLLGEYHEDLSWDSTHPSNNINDNGAATMTMTGLLHFFAALSIFPLRPNAPINLKKGYLPLPSLSVSLNY